MSFRARPRLLHSVCLLLFALLCGAGLVQAVWAGQPEPFAPPPPEAAPPAPPVSPASDPFPPYPAGEPAIQRDGLDLHSFYLTMRDGVRLAVDLYLPADLAPDEHLPTVVLATRYWRRADLRWPLELLRGVGRFEEMLVKRGFAVVKWDVRGSGASFGSRPMPWSPDEREDARQVLDWIVAQPWSNGRVAATGGSYVGTAAEFMAALGHPALRAVSPNFSLYDVYTDIAFPGGVLNEWFVRSWGRFNALLDANELPDVLGNMARMAVLGVAPVSHDPGDEDLLPLAVAEHAANLDIYAAASAVTFRDDLAPPDGVTVDQFSPHTLAGATEAGGAVFNVQAGWLDGGYAASALDRYQHLTNPQTLVIGPWNHGATRDANPFNPADSEVSPTRARLASALADFFDRTLRDGEPAPPIHDIVYYTMGPEDAPGVGWRHTPTWPPTQVAPLTWHLGPGQVLSQDEPASEGSDAYQVDFALGSGEHNRWRTQLMRSDVAYPEEAARDARMLVYTSAPLPRPLEITGAPVLTLLLAASATDTAVHAYLQAVSPKGEVVYLTEGMLRALHREVAPVAQAYPGAPPLHTFLAADAAPLVPGEAARLSFGLLPTSVVLPKGWRLRLALAGADADQFARIPAEGEVSWQVHWGPGGRSRLILPAAWLNGS